MYTYVNADGYTIHGIYRHIYTLNLWGEILWCNLVSYDSR